MILRNNLNKSFNKIKIFMKIFLDDIREVKDAYDLWKNPLHLEIDWTIVRNATEFCNLVKSLNALDIQCISWDHDLADEHYHPAMFKSKEKYEEVSKNFKEKTGFWCLQWLIELYMDTRPTTKLPLSIFHSQNPVGRENMRSLYESYNKSIK